MEQVNQNIAYKLPDAALNIIKAIDAEDEYAVYSANIINGAIVVVKDELFDGSLVSINGKCAKDCATDRALNRKLFDTIHHDEDKPLDVRSVFIMRDSREDKQQQKQNGKVVLTTYKFDCDNGESHSMVVVDNGELKDYDADNLMANVKSDIYESTVIGKLKDETKAAAKEGFFNGANELFAALAQSNNILANDVKHLSDLMLSSFEPQAGQ